MSDIAQTGHRWDASRQIEWRRYDLGKRYIENISGKVPKPIHVNNRSTARDVLALLEDVEELAIDSEFDPEDNDRLYTWQFSFGDNRVLVDRECSKFFARFLANRRVRKIMHNAAADLPVFANAGIEVNGFFADTMVLDFLVNENRPRHGLKYCGPDWLGIPMVEYAEYFAVVPKGKKKAVLPHISEIILTQWPKFLGYATLDAYVTYWLYRHHRAILERLPAGTSTRKGATLWDYYVDYESEFTLTLSKMMKRGIAVDVSILKEIGKELSKTIARSRHIFVAYAPEISVTRQRQGTPYVEVIQPSNINLQSPQQLSALFYDELGCSAVRKGRNDEEVRSTDVEHLTKWADEGNVLASCLLEHRRASTMRGTFIGEQGGKGLLAHVVREVGPFGPYDLIRTEFNQIGAVTMRLSSRDPNLQNIPARKEKDPYRIRRAFRARQGHKLVVADYSLFELRVMAHFSRDPVMTQALKDGRDLHSITAKKCFKLKCAEEEVKEKFPDFRNKGKSINFGLQYGMKAWLLGKSIGVEPKEAQKYIDAYFDLYQGVYNWMAEIVESARVHGYVRTLLGRYRRVQHLEDVDPNDKVAVSRQQHAMNQAMNAPIQGTVMDIIKIAMNRIENDEYLKEREASLLLQVHDELVVECPELDAYQVRDRVREHMENAVKLRVPTPVDANVGDNWEEAKG
jgi:DNA polymerase I